METIKKLSRRTVYENRWMKVHEDQVQFPDGSNGIYGIVDKEDFALIIPRHADGRYQLVQQYRYPVEARYWEFPQGSWETKPGTNPEKVALGELEEETGYRAKSLTKLGHLFEAYGYSNQGMHVFLATELEVGQVNRDPGEQGMLTAAFSREEITRMIQSGEIKDAATVAALGLLMVAEQSGQ
ncbi:NUDIX hydrolase [Labrenzia sp. PHM005]|uniref:NUDIX domain-containing protein n=1 Tax=Labrenzia sp. PHM005 TaxID=2590016 RepID=UPI0011404D19|nr:NUDIX hydrolase [Labrenzia sp. PHM005]QDG74929.1 NUDIX hydrolase [Labrenzia sp. PHM005]